MSASLSFSANHTGAQGGLVANNDPTAQVETDPDIKEGEDIFGDIWEEEGNPDDGTDPTPSGTKKPGTSAKPGETPSPSPVPEYPYMIYVSKNSYTIAILGMDQDGEYSKLVRTFSTGIGRASAQTRAGNYTIKSKERWHRWGDGTYSPYAVRHSGGLWFHGPVYRAQDSNRMIPGSYNAIGTACSAGCLRTTSSAAAWIYYNCRAGTQVVIANDSKYTSSRPAPIDSSLTWDPTDPGANPEIPVTGFTIDPLTITLNVGQTASISVSAVKPEDTSTKTFTYTTSDESVVTCDASGRITAVGPGQATITVKADDVNGKLKRCVVTVTGTAAATPTAVPTIAPTPTVVPTPAPTPTVTPSPTPSPSPEPSPGESPEPSPEESPDPDTDP
ncbi:Ig-like domain-containing protein [Eubacteriales bacterium OttesenSCG-928-N14]|nr:Ig-like domain-containing protein [Eubacteriales bacterium OttesenSCG-928-N14]